MWLAASNLIHRKAGPAMVEYYENGNISTEIYYYNERIHRIDGPAWVSYNKEGGIYYKYFFFHGVIKPAYVEDEDWQDYANLQIYR
jgi:hypothetical protein